MGLDIDFDIGNLIEFSWLSLSLTNKYGLILIVILMIIPSF